MSDGQKYTSENRPGRVVITYDTNVNGAQQKVELPFVVGVMADLSGNAGAEKKDLEERDFSEVSANTLDTLMEKSIKPRLQFTVDSALEDGQKLEVDLSFTSMDDFSPAAIARNLGPLKELFAARQELQQLLTMMGGKSKAEKMVEELLRDNAGLKEIASALNQQSRLDPPSTN